MPLLETIAVALAPYIVDMIIAMFKAEEDPKLDTGDKKHDCVVKHVGEKIGDGLAHFENRDVADALNYKIHETVKMFNDNNVFKKD